MDVVSARRLIALGGCSVYWRQNILKYIKELESTQWMSPEEVQKLQWIKLKKLLDYAYTNVSYYKNMFEESDTEPNEISSYSDYRKLKTLTKKDINSNIDSIISSSYKKKDFIKNSTGGSTGINLNFYNDRKRSAFKRAMVFRNDSWADFYIGDKNAVLWGSPLDISISDTARHKVYQHITRSLFLPSYNLSGEHMKNYTKKLINYNPKTIIGYASALYHFAKYLDENEIRSIAPKSIISSAEVLYEYQRELIESIFQCKVFNRYGCREFSTIAQECSEHSGFHINAEHVYVECLKENGMPADLGERGELVITDLDNYAMPLIRYKIGDMGILSNCVCDCGRGLPMLKHIEGRTFDVIVRKDGKCFDGHFFPIVIRTVEGIDQYQVIQEKHDELVIKLVIRTSFRSEYLDILMRKIMSTVGPDMKITFEIVDQIEPAKSGKFKFIISNVASNFGDSTEDES